MVEDGIQIKDKMGCFVRTHVIFGIFDDTPFYCKVVNCKYNTIQCHDWFKPRFCFSGPGEPALNLIVLLVLVYKV